MAWMTDRNLHSPEFLALPHREWEWTPDHAHAAHAMAQRTPAFLRAYRLSALAPDVNAQHVRYLGDIRTIGQWLDASPETLMGGNGMSRRTSMYAVAIALDKLRDASPDTFVDGTPWPTGIRNKLLLSLSRGLVLAPAEIGARSGWRFMRPVISDGAITGFEDDERQRERAGTEHDHLYQARTLHELGILERLRSSKTVLWLSAAGAREADERYGSPSSDYSRLRTGGAVIAPVSARTTSATPYRPTHVDFVATPDPLPAVVVASRMRGVVSEKDVEIRISVSVGDGIRTLRMDFEGDAEETSIPDGLVALAASCLRRGVPLAVQIGMVVQCREDDCRLIMADLCATLHHDDASMVADLLEHGRDGMSIIVEALHVGTVASPPRSPASPRRPLVTLSPGRVADVVDGDVSPCADERGDRRRTDEQHLRNLVSRCEPGHATTRETTSWTPPMPNLRALLHAQSRSRMSSLKKLLGRGGRDADEPFRQRTHHVRGIEWHQPGSSDQNEISFSAMADLAKGGWATVDREEARPTSIALKAARLSGIMTIHFGSRLDEMPSGDVDILPGLRTRPGSPALPDGQMAIIDMDRDAVVPMPFIVGHEYDRDYAAFTARCMEMGYGPQSRAEPVVAWGGLLWPMRPHDVRLHRDIMPQFGIGRFGDAERRHMMASYDELRSTRTVNREMVPEPDLMLLLSHTRKSETLTTAAFVGSRHDVLRARQDLR